MYIDLTLGYIEIYHVSTLRVGALDTALDALTQVNGEQSDREKQENHPLGNRFSYLPVVHDRP